MKDNSEIDKQSGDPMIRRVITRRVIVWALLLITPFIVAFFVGDWAYPFLAVIAITFASIDAAFHESMAIVGGYNPDSGKFMHEGDD